MIQRIGIQPTGHEAPAAARPAGAPSGPSFAGALQGALRSAREVKFSAHAVQRLRERNITLNDADKARLSQALDSAEAKGARQSLVVMDQAAFVANVPNRTIITVVPQDDLEDNVFTNIDSAVVVARREPQPHTTKDKGWTPLGRP